jgi:SpoVK/Ycf46/Vps4 family AAA+-type ATPase
MYEIMEIDDVCKDYSHTENVDFILMPFHNKKELICPIKNIYLEISVSLDDNSDEKNEKTKKTAQSYKQYSCKISTPGSNAVVLQEFIDECIKEHKEYTDKTTHKQLVFEYSKTEYDDNDKRVAKYIETPFVSNKYLDKNIFFPEKEHFLKQVNKFVHNKEYHRAKYMQAGQTYKLTLLLYGEPGTGKTCILRGLLNHTKRDAIWVPWSNVKTCSDLASILRANKFNGKPRQLKDVIFIFEDFDANSSKVLKKRKLVKKKTDDSPDEFTLMANTLAETASDLDTPKEILDQIKSLKEFATNMMGPGSAKMDDELTLEYALNMFDGIVEQDDAIIAFTTNHLEDIDPAVFRPGRVDYMLELKKIEVKEMKLMLKCGYSEYEESKEIGYEEGLQSGVISAARVQMEIIKEESLELGLAGIRRAICEAGR